MNRSFVTTVVATAGLTVSGLSFATTPACINHWYAGAGINYYAGQTETAAATKTIELLASRNLNNQDASGGVFVGYQLSKHFATEAGFDFYGKRKYESAFDYYAGPAHGMQAGYAHREYRSTWDIHWDGIYRMPLVYGFKIFAKGGVNYFHSKESIVQHVPYEYYPPEQEIRRDPIVDINKTDKLHTVGIDYGAGVQYDYKHFGIRAVYTAYKLNKMGANFTEPSFLNLDVMYHFV